MNQFRKSINHNLLVKLRRFICKFFLGYVGNNLYLEKNVQFLRNKKNISLHNNIAIKEGAKICSCNSEAKIEIFDNVSIGYNTLIFSSKSITIGKNTMIGSHTSIIDSKHGNKIGMDMVNQNEIFESVEIGEDVWIGANCVITSGTKINNGVIVGPGTVIWGELESNCIYLGNPHRFVGKRK